nr:nudix hydrolase 11-like [Ipomoea batatas]
MNSIGLLTNLECFVLVGEVALPGGKVEEGDANDIETALREAKEEIGLDPSLVDVVTNLESFTNKSTISTTHNNDITRGIVAVMA